MNSCRTISVNTLEIGTCRSLAKMIFRHPRVCGKLVELKSAVPISPSKFFAVSFRELFLSL
jgi:hypothetical protein